MSATLPRLQMRWEKGSAKPGFGWSCHYELVMPLGKHDVRATVYDDAGDETGETLTEFTVAMKGPSVRGSSSTPCVDQRDGSLYYDSPFRDGAHAQWDAALLGNLPVFVMALDGTLIPRPPKEEP